MVALIFLAALIAYSPALQGGFIWDDAGHVTRADLRSFSGLFRIWFEIGATQQYYPVLHSAFWVEHRLWGEAPSGYHLLNVLLHATSACLLAGILRRLAIPGAWLAASLFVLHPVAVESVAWIAEQKNTLSTVFYLAAAIAYLRYDENRRPSWYVLASVGFLLAVLTKSVTVTLPAALLVIIWWRRGKLEWSRDVLRLLPWFVVSGAMGIVTAAFERSQIGAQGADFALSWLERVLLAGRVIWFYFGKLLWPADLIFVYPRWNVDSSVLWQYVFPLGVLAVFGALWFWKKRGALAAGLFFAGSLFPALGFINVFPFLFSFVADHFQYLPSLGIFAAIAAGLSLASGRLPRGSVGLALGLLLGGLGLLTWQQCQMYHDSVVLFETTLARNPAGWMAHNNLGNALVAEGQPNDAISHFEQALQLRPNFAEAEANLGDSLNQVGRSAEAIPHLEHAIQLQPNFAEAHNNLGAAFMTTGQAREGIAQFEQALQIKPTYARARFNVGLALASSGKTSEAIPNFEQAARLDPNFGEAELYLGIMLTLNQRFPEAQPHFERALQLDPNSPDVHYKFGRALDTAGHFEDAIAQYRAALELNPGFGAARSSLADALRKTGHSSEAEEQARGARSSSPNFPPLRN
jgi:tetratricopeptide (TPR) repeat protein